MEEQKAGTPLGFLSQFGEKYGPYAFGVLSLLLIWFSIVKPELQANQLRMEDQRQLVSDLRQLASKLEEATRNLDRVRSK